MITAKDVMDMVERVDARLFPLCDYENFEPYQGVYRLGDSGYVTEEQYMAAFDGEPYWAETAYMVEGNGVEASRIAEILNTEDLAGLSEFLDEMFDTDNADYVFYTEATEEGTV
ncbi:hypothetical protein GFD21_06645 [Bifidobacterium sp. SMA15]|uniref:Uncharacterized protein n=2 Tax=Bifidobacterium platyrrhinorum TaxID=2661628 RepID=A0A6L9STM4_9BIFI|nr:hypothetical protein [Bifidobacterium platyrrhinorum]